MASIAERTYSRSGHSLVKNKRRRRSVVLASTEEYEQIDQAVRGVKQAPPSQRDELRRRAAKQVTDALSLLKSKGQVSRFACERESQLEIQETAQWQLKTVGIDDPSALAQQSTER